MGFFSSGGKGKGNSSTPKYTGMQLQTSCYGSPIPVVYGTTRIGINLGWYGDFQQHQTSNGGAKGGVVGGGKGGTTTTYSASVVLLACEGPIGGFLSMWTSQTQKAGTPNFTQFLGAYAQAPWTYLTSNHPNDAFPYSGVAYIADANDDLGGSGSVPNINLEIQGFFAGSAPGTYGGNGCANGGDADPSLVVPDVLTNANYGVGFAATDVGAPVNNSEAHTIPGTPFQITVTNAASFLFNLDVVDNAGNIYTCVASAPASRQYSFNATTGVYTFASANAGASITINYASRGSLTQYQNWCLASGLWMSAAYRDATPASNVIDEIGKATYSEFVWSSGLLNLVPRGFQSLTANGYTFTPNTTAAASLTEDDFMPNTGGAASTDDPVQVTRSRVADQINSIKIECLDRSNQYAPAVVEAFDQGMIDKFGKRASTPKATHILSDVNAANVSAALQLQDEYIRNAFSFQVDERYCWLDPMDLLLLTDTKYPGLTNVPVRIVEITENDDGTLAMTVEQYPGTLGNVPAYSLNIGGGAIQNLETDPGPVNTPIMFAAPPALASNQGLELWLFLSGSNAALYGGSQVWVANNTSGPYTFVGELKGNSRMGVTTGDFPVGSDPDTTHTLAVDLTESLGSLSSGTQTDADNAATLCAVVGANGLEFVSYETATLTATNKYNLTTYIRRGQYSSAVVDHPNASPFVRCDGLVFRYPYQASQIGTTLYFKFAAFNIYEGGLESLATVTAYPIVIPAPPAPGAVTNFSAQPNGSAVALGWTDLTQSGIKGYDILYGKVGGTIANATMLTEASRQTAETTVGIPPGTWTIYIRARDIANQTGPASSVNVTVSNPNSLIASQSNDPDWLGAKVGYLVHYTGVLVPDQTTLASAMTNAALFTQFCQNPVSPRSYTAPTLDTGVNATVRVWASIVAQAGPGIAGTASATFALDYWLSPNSDPGTFFQWTIGSVSAEFLVGQIADASSVQSVITNFDVNVDAPLQQYTVNNVVVSNVGTTINFAALGVGPFHSDPNIQVTAADGVGTSGGASAITTTDALIEEFTGSTQIGGTVNLLITGV